MKKFAAEPLQSPKNKGIELKEPGMMKKAMMWGSIKLNTLADGSRAHIAEMMIQGTVMGITSLRTSQSQLPLDPDPEIVSLLEDLIGLEERFEERLKTFL